MVTIPLLIRQISATSKRLKVQCNTTFSHSEPREHWISRATSLVAPKHELFPRFYLTIRMRALYNGRLMSVFQIPLICFPAIASHNLRWDL